MKKLLKLQTLDIFHSQLCFRLYYNFQETTNMYA